MKQLAVMGMGILALSAHADQPAKNVHINIHNETPYVIHFNNIGSLSAFEHINMSVQTVAPYQSEKDFIIYEGFDFKTQRMTFDVVINQQLTTAMWYINMGPVNSASHICGVVPVEGVFAHCELPRQDPSDPDNVLIDYYFELKP